MIDEFLPCRKCGSRNYDYSDKGSEVTIQCRECNNFESVQITDVLEYEERYSEDPDWGWNPETLYHGKKALEKARKYLIEEWNMRFLG